MCPFTIYGFKRFVNTNEIHQLRLRCSVPRTKSIVALIGGEDDERNNGGTEGFTIGAPQGSMVRRISKAYALF
jgi:hypothetical protein